jgi:hypothetical protein
VQVVTNDRLVKRESRIGAGLLGVTFFLLGLGLFLSFQAERWLPVLEQSVPSGFVQWVPIAITYAIVLVGMGFYYLGNARVRRYGPQHRQDNRLRQLLKGLDDRYVLYAYLGRKLPDYVLVGPSGVYVLTTRPQEGEITCRDDRWSSRGGLGRRIFGTLYGSPMGNPSYDTGQGVARVRELLRRNLPGDVPDPPVSGLIVFTGERVRLRVERCSFPATTAKELRKVVGKIKTRLNATQLGPVRAVFEATAGG